MTELIREYWDWFLFDTLVWTGALLGFALLLRRSVAKHLGAGAAYALWFLPLARLLFPPVTLPAWMKPAFLESAPAAEPVVTDLAPAPAAESGFSYADVMAPMTPATMESPVDFVVPLVILWLVGAAIFMGRRFWLYGELRRELLEDARPVGEVGNIRLVETTAISGPMAFGVIDKVVALPDGFMASRERQVRDLAIAHELEHHRGHDILVNVLIQPLFAVHWFNPLGWMGWTAMRRDQEAFCDARVVASRSRDERAAYAAIIADFARRPQIAPRPALAAPMACPVLGDKSIIHRLRSLPMTDHSRRRRVAARGAVAAAVLALPMTASICYVGASPALATAVPELTEVVSPVGDPVIAKRAELASFDADGFAKDVQAQVERQLEKAERDIRRAERQVERSGKARIVWNGRDWDAMTEKERREFKREMKELRKQFADGGEYQREMERVRRELAENNEWQVEMRSAMAEAQAEAVQARAEALAEAAEARAEALAEAAEARAEALAEAAEAVAEAKASVRAVEADTMRVVCGDKDVRQEFKSRSGDVTVICDSKLHPSAVAGLREARADVARDAALPRRVKAEILRSMDSEIARLER